MASTSPKRSRPEDRLAVPSALEEERGPSASIYPGNPGFPWNASPSAARPLAGLDLAYEAIRIHYAAYWAAEEGRRISL